MDIPHFILKNIILLLDNNIDRICFSLVCKKWFNERDKYLEFINQSFESKTCMKSYKNIIESSTVNDKEKCLTVDGKFLFKNYKNEIPKDIGKLSICLREFECDKRLEQLLSMLDDSNVHSLLLDIPLLPVTQNTEESRETCILSSNMKIKSIEFGNKFDQKLKKGYLPPLLERLTFSQYYPYQFDTDVLPLSLVYLKCGPILNSIDSPNQLPKKLKHLEFISGNSLSLQLNDNFILNSLDTLINIKLNKKSADVLRCFTTLTKLELTVDDTYLVNTNDIPVGVEDLKITTNKFGNINVEGVFPSTVKTLHIVIKNPELLSTIPISPLLRKSILTEDGHIIRKYSIKCLTLQSGANSLEYFEKIPNEGLEKLVLKLYKIRSTLSQQIPSCVQSLAIQVPFDQKIESGIIPNGIIELDIGDSGSPLDSNILPPSLSHLIVPLSFFKRNKLSSLPLTLNCITILNQSLKAQLRRFDSNGNFIIYINRTSGDTEVSIINSDTIINTLLKIDILYYY